MHHRPGSSPARIGILHPTFESWGGAEWFIHQTAGALGAAIYTHRWSDPPGGGERPAGLVEHGLGGVWTGPPDWAAIGRVLAPRFACHDALLAHNFPALEWVVEARREGPAPPVVWYCHEPPSALYDAADAPGAAGRLPSARGVFKALGGEGLPGLGRLARRVRQRLRPASLGELQARDRAAVLGAAAVLANSRFTAARLKSIYGIDARVVAPVPADLSRFTGERSAKQPLVLWVGRLTEAKRPLLMIDVWRQARAAAPELASWRLLLVGDGPLAAAVREAAGSRELSGSVSLRSSVPRDELMSLYRAAAVTVHLGVREPFGIVALESAAAGTPVIAESHGGASEILRDGQTGWLVDGLDAENLARRLARLPETLPALEEMGRRASADIASRFRFEDTIEALRHALEEAYRSVSSK